MSGYFRSCLSSRPKQVRGFARQPLFCTQKLRAGTAPFPPVFITKATSFNADSPRGSALTLGAGEEKGDLGEKQGTGRNSQVLETQRPESRQPACWGSAHVSRMQSSRRPRRAVRCRRMAFSLVQGEAGRLPALAGQQHYNPAAQL